MRNKERGYKHMQITQFSFKAPHDGSLDFKGIHAKAVSYLYIMFL